MRRTIGTLIELLLLLAAGGCGILSGVSTAQPTAQPTTAFSAQTASPLTPTSTAEPIVLRIWLPPQYDPRSETEAGTLLQKQLTQFEKNHPGVLVETRIKPVEGEASLIASLEATSAAAPSALPDLIALPTSDLEAAAVKGLLEPFDRLTNILTEKDWYPYATQMAVTEGSTFGLPFGGDTQVLLYRPALTGPQKENWDAIIRQRAPVAFPAGDPNALFVLSLYRSAGGILQDDGGRPVLDSKTLTAVYDMMLRGVGNGIFPFWMTELSNDDAAWRAYSEKRTQLAITWLSRYLDQVPTDTAAIPVPGIGTQPAVLATGWMWGLATADSERQKLAVQLAESLTAPEFLSQWTPAIHLLPTRPSSLAGWENFSQQSLVKTLAENAQVMPNNGLLASLGPVLSESTLMVFKGQGTAENIATTAANQLLEP